MKYTNRPSDNCHIVVDIYTSTKIHVLTFIQLNFVQLTF